MNYFEHHIGDYAAATGHLSLVEDAVYSRLLRRYYLQEGPLPADVTQVSRLCGARQADELAAVESILAEFFCLSAEGWHNKRADEEIARYREKQAGKEIGRENEAERKRRYRQRRSELFSQLRDIGIVPGFETTTDELVLLLSRGTAPGQDRDGTATHTPSSSHQSPEVEAFIPTPDLTPSASSAGSAVGTAAGRAAAALNRIGLRTTSQHPDLIAACQEGVTTELLLEVHGLYPGKPAAYIVAAARRIHSERAQPVGSLIEKPSSHIKPSAADNFRGQKYAGTPIEQLPPALRAAAETALASNG